MQERRLTPIKFSDIIGYTALVGSDEDQAFHYVFNNQS